MNLDFASLSTWEAKSQFIFTSPSTQKSKSRFIFGFA